MSATPSAHDRLDALAFEAQRADGHANAAEARGEVHAAKALRAAADALREAVALARAASQEPR